MNTKIFSNINVLLGMAALLVVACGPVDRDENGNGDEMNLSRDPGKAEAIDYNNNPDIFGQGLEKQFDKLPLAGEAKRIPWPGNYWPIYKDAINDRWDGPESLSPAGKYGKAFNVPGLEDLISAQHGIDSQRGRKVCKDSSECNPSLGEECSLRAGRTEGRCIPTWFGLCHAWSPAAILEPEPLHEVSMNGVTFKINDIKALITLAYNRSRTRFLSGRCNLSNSAGDIVYDSNGRPTAAECRDTNPGTYHLILANYLGLKGESLVEDVTFDDQVWNQPMRGFQVEESREVTPAEANGLIGVGISGGQTQKLSASVEQGAWFTHQPFDVQPGTFVQVIMKNATPGDSTTDADLYVRFGADPKEGEGEFDCRPYDMGNNEICTLPVPEGASKVHVAVKGESAGKSSVELAVTLGGVRPTTYEFNGGATKLLYVRTSAGYIVESSPSTDGNLATQIDAFTQQATYEYILELDARGVIVGGEWVGASKTSHPDFLWLPLSNGAPTVAGVSYQNVKELLNRSLQPVANP